LVFVDNGSTDGTVEYLRGVRNARLIANADHRGFPAAVNQGIAIAQGDQLLLLNNDVVVATGWLRRLLDALESGSKDWVGWADHQLYERFATDRCSLPGSRCAGKVCLDSDEGKPRSVF